MGIKLIACDLDDTLLNDDLVISDENLSIIKKVNDAGIHFILCSGRSKPAMERYIKQVGAISSPDYGVAYNGALVYGTGKEEVFSSQLEENVISRLVDISKEWDISLQLYHDNKLYVEDYNEYTENYIRISADLEFVIIDDLKDIKNSYKALYNYKSCRKLDDLRLNLIKEFPNLNIFYSKPEFLEVMDVKASKGCGIEKLASILEIDREEVLCVGDGLNDLSMIEYAGVGIAMQNGNAKLKNSADYITNRGNNESVLIEIYDKFIKNNTL